MDHLIEQFYAMVGSFQQNLYLVLSLVGLLWAVHLLNWLSGHRLTILGIFPRNLMGLPGILFHPFLHGHFNHLFFNSVPLFVLASCVLFSGTAIFVCVSLTIIVLSGLAIWLVGRPGVHIGASGLIMGFWSFLIMNAYHSGTVSVMTLAPAIVCIYYFGGFIFQLFPTEVRTSWEAHLFGFLAGIAATYTCPEGYCKWSVLLCAQITRAW